MAPKSTSRDGRTSGWAGALMRALCAGGGQGSTLAYMLIGAATITLVVCLFWLSPSFLTGVDLKALDAFFSLRGASAQPPEVVVVAVDERSINALGRWPWPRTVTAALIRALAPARTVAVDMVFSEPGDFAADTALSGAIAGAGNVTLGYFFRTASTGAPPAESLAQVRGSRITLVSFTSVSRGVGPADLPLPSFDGIETNTALVGRGAEAFGPFNIIPDTDGLYRVANLVFARDGELYPSLALKAATLYLGSPQIVITAAPYGVDSIAAGRVKVPVDERGGFTVNYYDRSPSFTTYPAVDVIEGRVPGSELAGKLVFVGVTETGIYDVRPTPLDALYPGVEIHATVAANIIEGRYLVRDTRVVIFDLVMVVVFPIILLFIISRVRTAQLSLASFALLLGLFVAGEFVLFNSFSIVTAPVYPVLSATVAYLSGEAYRNIVVERRSRYLRKAFSSYVSSQLVTELLSDPARLKLGGEKRPVTVLFSDIRGFTTIAERMGAEELVRLLNEYLSPMTGIVLEEEGMLDKYIGDAIMAIFNAPVEVAHHPARACTAALRMISRLDALNAGWEERGWPRIEIGVGINTGEAVVGNMGAELRFDYTAIGDTVNLASRLEGMNKLYGTRIIVTEETRRQAGDVFLFRELDRLKVKGKDRAIVIFELLCPAPEATASTAALVEAFARGLALYREKNFGMAATAFRDILDRGDDTPSRLFLTRCEEFAAAPPPDGWDGTHVALTK